MEKYKEVIDEAINLEYNVGELYRVYAERFVDDKDFWIKISEEEEHHAEILAGVKMYTAVNEEERKLLYQNYEVLKKANADIRDKIELFKKGKSDKKTAYEYAYFVENSAFEIHFQSMMEQDEESELLKKMKYLNGSDKDHAERILKMIKRLD